MAEKISIQIALEGGAEIASQLEGIGEAGQKAFADIAKSAEQAGGFKQLDPSVVTDKLKEMGVTGVEEINKIQQAVQSAGRLETLVQGINSVETAFSALAAAAPVIGTVIAAAFTAATVAAVAFANAVNKISDQATNLGTSIQKVDQFRASLEQAGISAEGINTILAQAKSNADKFNLDQVKRDAAEVQRALSGGFGGAAGEAFKRLQQAADEFTPAGKAAREELVKMGQAVPGIGGGLERLGDPILKLGASTKDIRELGVELAKLKSVGIDIKISDDAVTQAQKLIEGLAKMPDAAKAAQIALQQFGPAGAELVAAFRTGSITADQFRERFGTLTKEQEEAANKQRQVMNTLSADWERFKIQVAAPIAVAGMAAITATWEAFKALITTTGQELNAIATTGASVIAALAAPINSVIQVLTQVGVALRGITWDAISGAGTAAWNAIIGVIQSAGSAISTFVSSLAGITWDAISAAGVAAWNAIIGVIQSAVTAVSTFASSLAGIVWDTVSGLGVAAWDAVSGAIQGAIDKMLEFLRWLGLVGAPGAPVAGGAIGGGAPGAASGGLLGGRGTGTSDSNLAWVSRGEHIMPARAVAQPGVLAFLEALRRSGGNLSRVLDGMGRFALGGMVPRMPAFAAGGAVGSMSHVTIAFPGLPPISGLRASSAVVDELHRAAALAQVRSGGRKPSRYS
jgi:hypothetical protein